MAEPLKFQTSRPRLRVPTRTTTPQTPTPARPARPRLRIPSRSSSSDNGYDVDLASPELNIEPTPAPRSTWEQLAAMPGDAAAGATGFLKESISAPWNLVRVVPDLARSLGAPISGKSNLDMSGNAWQDVQAGFREYLPLVADIATGFRGAVNVTGIGSEENVIGRYQTAVEEGRWIEQATNDVANLALVGGPTAKILGRTSRVIAADAGASALVRRAGFDPTPVGTRAARPFRRLLEPDRPATSGTLGGASRPLSSSYQRPVRLSPPDVAAPNTIPLSVPGNLGVRRLPVIPEAQQGLAVGSAGAGMDLVRYGGRGLAGRIERRANPSMRPNIEPSSAALRAERAGEIVGKVSLGAQYADPADALLGAVGKGLGVGGRAVARVAPKVAEVVSPIVSPTIERVKTSNKVKRIRTYLAEQREGQRARDQIDQANSSYARAAVAAQNLIEQALKREDIPRETRDVYGGVVMAATDQALDAAVDAWVQAPVESKDAVLREINAKRLPNEAITPEVIEAYLDFRNNRLSPQVSRVIREAISRTARQVDDRTRGQLAQGNIRIEDIEVPTRRSDGTPLAELSQAQRDAAFRPDADGNIDVVIPYKPSLLEPKRDALNAKAQALRDEVLPAQAEALNRAARELATTQAWREALPQPGTDVPEADTPGYRAAYIEELADRRDALTLELARALDEQSATEMTERIDALVRTIELLDDDIAELRQTADSSFAELQATAKAHRSDPSVRLADLDDGETIQTLGARTRIEMHQEALDRHKAMFGNEAPRASPPRSLLLRGRAFGRKESNLVDGTWDYFAKDSAIWSGRRARRWYTLKGWLSPQGRGMYPDEWFQHVRDVGDGMANKSNAEIVDSYLDSIDYIYDTNRPAHMNDAVIEIVSLALDMDPELVYARLRSKTAYKQALRKKMSEAAADVVAGFDALDDQTRQQFLTDMRDLAQLGAIDGATKAQAFYEVLGDIFDEAREGGLNIGSDRDMFEHLMGAMSFDQLLAMLDDGSVSEAVWRKAEDAVLLAEGAKADAQAMLDDLEARRPSAATSAADVSRSLVETLDRQIEAETTLSEITTLVEDGAMAGTNPTPPKQWEGGSPPQGVQPYKAIADMGPPRDTRPKLSPAEALIEQETRRRVAYEDARREVYITQQRIEAYERRAAQLETELGRTRQDRLYEINRRSVARMQKAARSLSPTQIGGYEVPSSPGQPIKLTGLIGNIAHRMNLTARVVEILDDVLADRRAEYDSIPPELKPDDFSVWLRREELRADEGQMNLAAIALKQAASEANMKLIDQDRFEIALVAQDLERTLDAFYGDNMMGAQAAHEHVTARIANYTDEMRARVSDQFLDELYEVQGQHMRSWHGELNMLLGERMAMIPARFRTPIQEANRAVRALLLEAQAKWDEGTAESRDVARALTRVAERAPTSFDAFARTSDSTPLHLIGGSTASVGATVRRSVLGKKTAPTPTVRAVNQRTEGFRANTLREYARIEADEMARLSTQAAMGHIAMNSPYAQTAFDAIPERIAEWRANNAGPLLMKDLRQMLTEEGFSVMEGFGDADTTRAIVFPLDTPTTVMDAAGRDVTPVDIGLGTGRLVDTADPAYNAELPNIRVMPTKLYESLREYNDKTSPAWLTLYDQTTQLWKTATLAWSVAWVTYNAIGNAMMAGFSAGLSPIDIIARLDQIRETVRSVNDQAGFGARAPLRTALLNDTLSSLTPGRLSAHGLSWSERAATMNLADADTRMGRALQWATDPEKSKTGIPGRITEFSYGLNEFTDNMFRTAVFLDQLEKRLLKEAAVPPRLLDRNGNLRHDLTPEEHAIVTNVSEAARRAQDQAVSAALNTMGDFTRLTPAERKYVKRVFPFYPWLRHQTAMVYRIPLTNPLRWAWMQSLDDLLNDDADGEHMRGLLGGMFLTPAGGASLRAANPLSMGLSAFGSENEGMSIFDPRSLAAAMNPLIKLPVEMIFGKDVDGDGNLSRPASQKVEGAFGEAVSGSAASRLFSDPASSLRELAFNTAGMVPQTRGLRDMALSAFDARPRYDDGSPIPYLDNKPDSLLQQAAKALRVPFVPSDVSRLIEVAEKKDLEKRRADMRRILLRDAARSSSG